MFNGPFNSNSDQSKKGKMIMLMKCYRGMLNKNVDWSSRTRLDSGKKIENAVTIIKMWTHLLL